MSLPGPAPHEHGHIHTHPHHLGEIDASLYLHPQTLARLSSFELRAKLIIEGLSSGLHRSPFQGFSVEFAQHRPYTAGDDIRHLDWKVFARTDKLQIKQYQQETNLDLVVLVDSSGSMNYGSRTFADASGSGREVSLDGRPMWTKFDHATALAAALAYITLRQGDRVGLTIFADQVRANIKRSSGQSAWRPIVAALATHPDQTPGGETRGSRLRRCFDQILSSLTNRCVLALVSDLFHDIEDLKEALARVRHAGHDLIAFQTLDRAEVDFPFDQAAPFIGLEGEPEIRVDPRSLREAYLKVMSEHLSQVQRTLRAFNFDSQIVSTHDWLGPSLAAFVARRNAQLKRSKYG